MTTSHRHRWSGAEHIVEPAPGDIVMRDQRRRVAGQAKERALAAGQPLPADAWQIVEFAEAWSPFGGPPEEELFVRFGMTRSRFAEVLAHSMDQISRQLRPARRFPTSP